MEFSTDFILAKTAASLPYFYHPPRELGFIFPRLFKEVQCRETLGPLICSFVERDIPDLLFINYP